MPNKTSSICGGILAKAGATELEKARKGSSNGGEIDPSSSGQKRGEKIDGVFNGNVVLAAEQFFAFNSHATKGKKQRIVRVLCNSHFLLPFCPFFFFQ